MLYFCINCLAKVLDTSNCAALAVGPKHLIPILVNSSTIPATKGSSGPTTTRSIDSFFAKRINCLISVSFAYSNWSILQVKSLNWKLIRMNEVHFLIWNHYLVLTQFTSSSFVNMNCRFHWYLSQ